MKTLVLRTVIAVSVMLTGARSDSQHAPTQDIIDAGRATYVEWCASCHGVAATGYGPASWVLEPRPPDLTSYSRKTVRFPRQRLKNIISGHIRLAPSHGKSQMPIWRNHDLDPLLTYLDSIQAEKFGSITSLTPQMVADSGRRLFATHCMTCHGSEGRGPAPPDYVVGASMDLTTIAARNAGTFELRRVYEAIARCHDSEMPSWRRAFVRAGWGEPLTMQSIEDLATYVEAIQR